MKVALNTIKQTLNQRSDFFFISLSGKRSKKVLKWRNRRNWNLKNVEKHVNISLDLEIKLYLVDVTHFFCSENFQIA